MTDKTVISLKNVLAPEAGASAGSMFSPLEDFETRQILGKKGTRNFDRLTGLTIHGIDGHMEALKEQKEAESTRMGIVVASAQGSMDSIVRFTYETLAHGRPDFVNPALFPNTVMNCAAGQSAIWHGIKGPNSTISSGELSSLSAIQYGMTLIENDYADTLIVGGVEELTEVNQAAFKALAEKYNDGERFIESSVFYVIESETAAKKYQRQPLAIIEGLSAGFNPKATDAVPLTQLVESVLKQTGITTEDISVVSLAGLWPQTREVERTCFHQLFKNAPKLIDIYEQFGNANSSHLALQLHSVIEQLEPGQYGLVYAQDIKGNTGALVVSGGVK